MESKSIKEIVNVAYRNVTSIGEFDKKEGNKPIRMDEKLSDITERMKRHVDDGEKGGCFVFSSYIMEELKKNKIKCWMIGTLINGSTRASVLYEDNGELFVANPVEDIEYFTEGEIGEEERRLKYREDTAELISEDGTVHDNSRIPLQEFANRYGKVEVIGNFASENISLREAMMRKGSKIIAEPIENRKNDSQKSYTVDVHDISKLSINGRISMKDIDASKNKLGEIINIWLQMEEK